MTQILQIRSDRLGTVEEVRLLLGDLDAAYQHLYAFDIIVSEAKHRYEEVSSFSYGRRQGSSRVLRTISKPKTVILPQDQLRIAAVSFQSPGFWEFVGALNPLECVRRFVADRHERRKDRNYRERLEEERMQLENAKLRTEVVRDQVALLSSIGIPQDRIQAAIVRHVADPLATLEKHQDSRLIGSAVLIDRPSGKEPPSDGVV